ncbi:protein of unknown function [Burkholderia multivorans]
MPQPPGAGAARHEFGAAQHRHAGLATPASRVSPYGTLVALDFTIPQPNPCPGLKLLDPRNAPHVARPHSVAVPFRVHAPS